MTLMKKGGERRAIDSIPLHLSLRCTNIGIGGRLMTGINSPAASFCLEKANMGREGEVELQQFGFQSLQSNAFLKADV